MNIESDDEARAYEVLKILPWQGRSNWGRGRSLARVGGVGGVLRPPWWRRPHCAPHSTGQDFSTTRQGASSYKADALPQITRRNFNSLFDDDIIVEVLDVECCESNSLYLSCIGSFHSARVSVTLIRQNITPRGSSTAISRPPHHGRRPTARAVHQGQGQGTFRAWISRSRIPPGRTRRPGPCLGRAHRI